MYIPFRKEAESFLAEAQTLNPEPWFSHIKFYRESLKTHSGSTPVDDIPPSGFLV